MFKYTLLLLFFCPFLLLAQKFDFRQVKKDTLSDINSNPALKLHVLEKGEFKIAKIEGDFKNQIESLKAYILSKKEKANIGIANRSEINFERYQKCFFKVAKIYEEVWNEMALKKFKREFQKCALEEKEEVTAKYPLNFH